MGGDVMHDSDEGVFEGLGDATLAAKLIVEQDEQFEREAEAFQARVRAYKPPVESDDWDKDGGLGSGDWLKRDEW